MFVFGIRKPVVTAAAVLIIFFGAGQLSWSQEYIRDGEHVPESVDQVATPFGQTFKEKPRVPRFFPWLKEAKQEV